MIIDLLAWFGWATELKTVPENIIMRRIERTGDGSHKHSKRINAKKVSSVDENGNDDDVERDVEHFWGWGDKEMTTEDMKFVKIL